MARPIPSNIPSEPLAPLGPLGGAPRDLKPRGSGSQRPPSAEEPQPAVIQKPEAFKPEELFERPFFPSKPVPQPPNISPSSIPNPSPSVSVSAELPGYTSYLHNIPGFSAFRPVVSSSSQPPTNPMPPPEPMPPPDPLPPPPLDSLPAATPMFSTPSSMMPAPTPMFSTPSSMMPAPTPMFSTPSSIMPASTPMFSTPSSMMPASTPMFSTPSSMMPAPTPMFSTPSSMMPAPTPMFSTPSSMMPAPTPMFSTPSSMMPASTPLFSTPSSMMPASTPMFSTPSSMMPAPTSMMPAPMSMFSSAASLMPVPMAMYSAPTSMFSSAAPMIPALPHMYSATGPMFSAAMMPPSTLPTILAPMPMIPVPMIPTSMMPTLTAPTPMMPTSMMPTLAATTPMMPAPMMPAPMMPAPMMPAPMMPAPTPMMPAPPPMQPAPTPVLPAPAPMMAMPAPLTTSQSNSLQTETHNPEYQPFTITDSLQPMELEKTFREEPYEQGKEKEGIGVDISEHNFENNFAMKIISPTLKSDSNPQVIESKMGITSLVQGSGGSVIIPAPAPAPAPASGAGCGGHAVPTVGGTPLTMELRKPERFSLKTSIPISKIDIKCVSAPVDTVFQSAVQTPVFNPAFPKEKERPKLEIQSNIVIKPATVIKETNTKEMSLASDRDGVRNMTTPPATKSPLAATPPPVAKPPPPVKSPPGVKPPPAALLLNNNNSITTLINAAEAINKNDGQFRVPEPKPIIQKEVKKNKQADPPVSRASVHKPKFKSKDTQPAKMMKPLLKLSVAEAKKLKQQNMGEAPAVARNLFAPRRDPNKPIPTYNQTPVIRKPVEPKPNALPPPPAIIRQAFGDYKPKQNFSQKPPDGGEQKNLIVNNKIQNSKLLVTFQHNPQVLLQRTNFESKNLQTPSRLSSQSKRNEVIADTSSKVVALKKLHQDNCDENYFENLITENQIYGNKIVVKEKSQVTQEDFRKAKDRQADPDWKIKLKADVRAETPAESRNGLFQPNFVYLSNVHFASNFMMLRNQSKNICQTTDSTKMRVSSNENRTTEVNISNNNNVESNTAKIAKPQIISHREIHVLKSSNNVLQTLSNNNNKTEVVFQTNQKVIVSSQVVLQVPVTVAKPDNNNYGVIEANIPTQKKEIPKQMETKSEKMIITCQVDAKQPKILITSLRPKISTSPKAIDEISTLDIYEQKKRLRRLKYLTNTNKDVPKVDPSPVKKVIAAKPVVNIITPENMNEEILRELSRTRGAQDADSGASDSGDSDGEELQEYRAILDRYGPHHNDNAKADFLAGFNLATKEVFREKQLDRHERTLRFDAVASAYLAASDRAPGEEAAAPSAGPDATITWTTEGKSQFLAQFNLMQVSQRYKAEYEKSWQEILRERDRRNGVSRSPSAFDPGGQLQMLSAISQAVLRNNDRIKRRLDSVVEERSDIRILAEKNFSELNRLSKMADRSVKLFSGKESRKRDLNPGFDSENIKKVKIDPKKLPRIKIPDISKIISLRTDQVTNVESSSQATSMDEPRTSASCGAREGARDAGTQARARWPRAADLMDHFIKEYREYEIARKRETGALHRGNTALRVECAHVTRAASHESDRARALLAERRRLAAHEARLQASLELLTAAVQLILNTL